ncbi:MAG: GDP-perosamine synthase [bacterium]|nr:GDP-perosamine synthase [bacterium]
MEMTKTFIPKQQIGVGGFKIGEAERRYLGEVIDSSRLSYGPMTERFEAEFARLHDCRYAVFCNSGTSALHIALAALKERGGWADGDEVIVPAVTFVASSNIVLHNGMKPVFVDVERDTYNLDPTKIEAAITPRTRAILPVHLFGQPASMEGIWEVARKHNLVVFEDSAETMFARYKEQSVGTLGDIGCFSTYVAHILVTGVGGFATTNDPELAILLKSGMNHGRDSIYLNIDDDKGKTGEQLFKVVERRFKFVRLGHSFRCTELEAAIGLGQLEQAEMFLARRRTLAKRYTGGLSSLAERIQLPRPREDRTHSYMMYPMVLREESKWDLVRYLEERNIETREMMPLVSQPVYRALFGDIEDQYPVAKWINESGFYVGCHPYLADEEVDYIISQIHEYFRKR